MKTTKDDDTKKSVQVFSEKLNAWGEPELLFEMSNLRQTVTGLSVIVYVSPEVKGHLPRLKVQCDHSNKVNTSMNNWVSVSIEDEPKILAGKKDEIKTQDWKDVSKFIKKNKDLLIQYWNQEVDELELYSKIKKI